MSWPRRPQPKAQGCSATYVKQKTGVEVKVLAQGSDQTLDTARRGDADVVFVNARSADEKFLAEGFGVKRYPPVYNDFVVIGANDDPAGIKGNDVVTALQIIMTRAAPFVSRGDYSGTHSAELKLWEEAGIDIENDRGSWKEIGQGMRATLNMASASSFYALSDRDTWLAFHNRGDLAILVEGDKRMFNQYGVMLVSPGKHLKKEAGQRFVDFLISREEQSSNVASYKINGQHLFYPNANDPNA